MSDPFLVPGRLVRVAPDGAPFRERVLMVVGPVPDYVDPWEAHLKSKGRKNFLPKVGDVWMVKSLTSWRTYCVEGYRLKAPFVVEVARRKLMRRLRMPSV